jgi:hypothetical protein
MIVQLYRAGLEQGKKHGSRPEDLQLLPEFAVIQPLFAQQVLQDGGEC